MVCTSLSNSNIVDTGSGATSGRKSGILLNGGAPQCGFNLGLSTTCGNFSLGIFFRKALGHSCVPKSNTRDVVF